MNSERLLLLADRLDKVDPAHFDMDLWARSQKPCQTAGCALGYATTVPELFEAGLALSGEDKDWVPVFRAASRRVPNTLVGNVYGEGYRAAELCFALSHNEAHHIFNPERYMIQRVKPDQVAARIRELVTRGEL